MPHVNFRPVGTRTVGLYRSGDLTAFSQDEADELRQRWGIEYCLDLRTKEESEASVPLGLFHAGLIPQSVPMGGMSEEFRHLLDPGPEDYARLYTSLANSEREALGRAVGFLINWGRGALFGCYAGKDRTGLLAALVLGLLGHEQAEIEADYCLSRRFLNLRLDHFRRNWEKRGQSAFRYARRFSCESTAICAFASWVHHCFGSWEAYAGITPEQAGILKEAFLGETGVSRASGRSFHTCQG